MFPLLAGNPCNSIAWTLLSGPFGDEIGEVSLGSPVGATPDMVVRDLRRRTKYQMTTAPSRTPKPTPTAMPTTVPMGTPFLVFDFSSAVVELVDGMLGML